MRTVHLSRRPRARAGRLRLREHRGPRSRAARYLLLACCAPLAVLTGVAQLAGQAQAVPSRWTVTPTPNRGTGSDQLYGVSCPSAQFCMAVGDYFGDVKTLAAAWNGQAWSIIPSPTPRHSASPVDLFGVSCTSPSFCVAVGVYEPRPALTDRPLVETWNGKDWSITPSPKLGDSVLHGVSCVSAASCAAVGSRSSASRGTGTLAESWNGKTWSVIHSPSVNTNNVLRSVSCRSAASCVAVGSYEGAFGALTLVESWNGTHWSVIPSPNMGGSQAADWFTGVSCPSATNCAAVGGWGVQLGKARNLAESWNGKKWSIMAIPSTGPLSNLLGGVSCTSASNCVAAGFYSYGPASGPGNGKSLIESWNGSRWAITPSPSPRADNELYAVACTSAASCEAVGFAGKGSLVSDKTLVETGS